jgi:hypothetical protein
MDDGVDRPPGPEPAGVVIAQFTALPASPPLRLDQVRVHHGDPPSPGDEDLWLMAEAIGYRVDGISRAVPAGFCASPHSVPALGRWLARWELWAMPACWPIVVHDWLYAQPGTAKLYADLVFRALLVNLGANRWSTSVLYLSTRWLGGTAYAARQRLGPVVFERATPTKRGDDH